MANNLGNMNEQGLLKLYADLMEELRNRELIRSSNNPVADYAEKVAAEYLNLTRMEKQKKGYDALDKQQKKYQIKGRRITRHNRPSQLGVIRNLDEKLFDYLVVVIFNEDFSVNGIWKVPYQFVKRNSRYSRIQNGHIFLAKADQLSTGKGIGRIR